MRLFKRKLTKRKIRNIFKQVIGLEAETEEEIKLINTFLVSLYVGHVIDKGLDAYDKKLSSDAEKYLVRNLWSSREFATTHCVNYPFIGEAIIAGKIRSREDVVKYLPEIVFRGRDVFPDIDLTKYDRINEPFGDTLYTNTWGWKRNRNDIYKKINVSKWSDKHQDL